MSGIALELVGHVAEHEELLITPLGAIITVVLVVVGFWLAQRYL